MLTWIDHAMLYGALTLTGFVGGFAMAFSLIKAGKKRL